MAAIKPLGVARADRNVAHPQPVEGAERGAGDERTGIVGRDDRLAGADPGSRVAARRRRHPIVEVGRRQRNVARSAGGAARRKDAHDPVAGNRDMRAHRVRLAAARPDLGLLGEGKAGDRIQPADRLRRRESGLAELVSIEARMRHEIGDLLAIERVVEPELRLPRRRFDLGLKHGRRPLRHRSDRRRPPRRGRPSGSRPGSAVPPRGGRVCRPHEPRAGSP